MENEKVNQFKLSNDIYNKLKFIALVLLPALSTLYFSLGSIWGLSNVSQVVGTISSLDAFLGIVLGISTRLYDADESKYDGFISITETNGEKLYSLELQSDPSELDKKTSVTFKVG